MGFFYHGLMLILRMQIHFLLSLLELINTGCGKMLQKMNLHVQDLHQTKTKNSPYSLLWYHYAHNCLINRSTSKGIAFSEYGRSYASYICVAPFSLTKNRKKLKFDKVFFSKVEFRMVNFDGHRLFGFGLENNWKPTPKWFIDYDAVKHVCRRHLIPGLNRFSMPDVSVF